MSNLYDLVNIEAGTHSHFGFSTGNCLPITAMPFGMVHWSSQTSMGSPWFFHPDHLKFQGFRATRQPSPWIGDYGWIAIMPFTGEPPRYDADGLSSSYRRDLKPDRAHVSLTRYQLEACLFPTRTGATISLSATQSPKVCIHGASSARTEAAHKVHIKSTQASGGTPKDFACFYVLEFDHDVVLTEAGENRWVIAPIASTKSLGVKVASSFISFDQAEQNLVNDQSLDASQAWNRIFERFKLEGNARDLKVFANCLYRAHLFPRETHEYDAKGLPKHYSFYSAKVVDGIAVTDNGFWDTYRTVYPWFNLFEPSRSSVALQGWLAAYQEGGWFPQWASPGYRACMVGTHVDAVFADAVVKDVPGFDYNLALEGLLKHAYNPGDDAGAYGRLGIADYLAKGYVAEETVEGSVARSLDYAYNDWCIAQIANKLGKSDEAGKLLARSNNYRHLFDPSVGFMRAKKKDGSWAHFKEFEWGGPYVEGGPWQSSWAVQHDPQGLAALHGSEDKFATKLMGVFETEPFFEIGHYGFEIHEMTEMAQANFGQYAQSNQPVHHIIYFLHQLKDTKYHQLGDKLLRRVMNEMYTPSLFPGDEDNGEMACWFLWSSLGLFPFCPGKPDYVVGTSMFEKAEIRLENGKTLSILGGDKPAKWNGKLLNARSISHQLLASGGTLSFR